MARVWGVVVAGGTGTRFGGLKQFSLVGGRPVAERAVEACRAVCEGVVLVLPADLVASAGEPVGQAHGADLVVAGGRARAESVRLGLAVVPAEVEIVVVHDAARPLAPPRLFADVVAELDRPAVGGAVCAVPVTDTLKRVAPVDGSTPGDGSAVRVVETVDRAEIVAVQTPQAFRASLLRRAHAAGADATDDAALVEALGATVRVVPGDPRNVKLTTPEDLAVAELFAGS